MWASGLAAVCRRPFRRVPAWRRAGPATGPRLLVGAAPEADAHRCALANALQEHARAEGLSSAHILFVNEADRSALDATQYLHRKDCQFHWHNRGYESFEAFLATFRSEKRKKALRERRRIREAGIEFQTLDGETMDERLWDLVFGFSAATFEMRGHEHYLNAAFFRSVSAALPRTVVVKLAQLHRVPASFFVSVAYMCWADRRKIMTIKNGKITIYAP